MVNIYHPCWRVGLWSLLLFLLLNLFARPQDFITFYRRMLLWFNFCNVLIISTFWQHNAGIFIPDQVVRKINWFIYLKFILNLILILIVVLSFIWKLMYTILSLWMDLMCALCLGLQKGSTSLDMLKHFLLGCGKFWALQSHMSPSTLCSTAVSASLMAIVFMVSILQAGDWARFSTPARHFFFYLHYYYGLAPGFHSVSCPGSQWVVILLVSVKHWPI